MATEAVPSMASSPTQGLESQLEYIHKWWNGKNLQEYGYIPDNDCANFVSQSLVARGWQMNNDWFMKRTAPWDGNPDGGWWNFTNAKPWTSSTALYHYLNERPELARALTDSQRDQVKLGDIVQFDFDPQNNPPGYIDRDHTGIVTRIDKTPEGIKVYYASHTQAVGPGPDTPTFSNEFYSVDQALTDRGGGGQASYWSAQTP